MQSSHKQTGRAPEKQALGHGSTNRLTLRVSSQQTKYVARPQHSMAAPGWLGGQFALARRSVSKQEIEER